MNARERLAIMVRTNRGNMTVWSQSEVRDALDAYRTEVLREAESKAREIVAKLWVDGTTQTQLDRAGGARAVEWEIGLMASGNDEPVAPDFFQPGRTYLYARMQWKFRCDAVTSHPHTGKRVAVGYSGFGPADWQTSDLSEGVWADGDWTDITTAGAVTG